jgi:zinc protease
MLLSAIRRAWSAAFVLVLIAGVLPVAAQTQPGAGRETTAASVAGYPLSQQMPVDPEVLVGALPNGLRYYVRPNPRPARQAELRLVVKAGSVLEDDDQRGLAHFLEHMQFEGSRHFPGNGIEQFIGSLGLSIGADANAATSFDDTQYTLRVPTDVPGVLDRALTVLEDWAGGATFDPDAIDRQRAIVLAEWRMNLGASERIGDKVRRVQLEASRYADRVPIGNPEVIQGATREQLVRFYRDWYRPDLMAVIVVGDVDREQVAAMIRQHFGGLTNPEPERPRPVFDVPNHAAPRYAIVTDRETTTTAVRISNLRPARNQGTVGGYRDIMKDQLFSAMLDDRLDELVQSANPPYLNAAAGRGLFPAPRTRDEAILQALVASDGVPRGLEALATELQRVIRFGFTATELERAKAANMAGSERVVAESPDRESQSRADEYTRNFLQSEALPTIWQELAFHRRFLPEITLEEMNALALDWFPRQNLLVVVSAPETAGVVLPDQGQLAAVLTGVEGKRLEPYSDIAAGESLMPAAPVRGSIVKTTDRGDGITEWTLSNGATVVLKPTTLKTDQILFRATAPGGTSLASDADFLSARVADDVIPAGGVGAFNGVALDRMLTGKAVAVRPFIGEIRQGLGGGSTPQDVETLFQLIYQRFTQPRADPNAFASIRSQALAMVANQTASPEFVFNQALEAVLSANSPRRRPETADTIGGWSLDTAFAFYKARFADAGNFTFVFVGSFTPDQLKPLVETYIASLPSAASHETWRDLGIRPPTGIVERRVEKGIAPRSEVSIVFAGPMQYDEQNLLMLRVITLLLQSRLNDVIRQELGGTYSISTTSETTRYPRPEYQVKIDWTCDPARVDSLTQRVLQEVAFVRMTMLPPESIARIREVLEREFDRNSQDNGFLLNQIARKYEEGDAAHAADALELATELDAMNGPSVQLAALTYLDTRNYVKVTLMPER